MTHRPGHRGKGPSRGQQRISKPKPFVAKPSVPPGEKGGGGFVTKPSVPPGEKGGGGFVDPPKKIINKMPKAPPSETAKWVPKPEAPPGEKGGGGYMSGFDKFWMAKKIKGEVPGDKGTSTPGLMANVIPSSFSAFGYSLLGSEKPLTSKSFSRNDLQSIKNNVLQTYPNLQKNKPVVVQFFQGNPLHYPLLSQKDKQDTSFSNMNVGATLGSATAYVNDNGELIVTDVYDWNTYFGVHNPAIKTLTFEETAESLGIDRDDIWGTGNYDKIFEVYQNLQDKKQAKTVEYWKDAVLENAKEVLFNNKFYVGMEASDTETNASFGEKISSINNLLMDAGEGLVNILYPEERVPSEGIFAVPEEERMILNLGKVQ